MKLTHFDTKTKQDIGIKQNLQNCLAQYLFPDTKFSIGIAYPEATVCEDLEQGYEGMSLQFSSGEKMYFADNPNVRSLLYPNSSDGAAYPLPFTPCLSFHELSNVRVLVIDDITGENGNITAPDDAKNLVGDCKGLIDKDFAVANGINQRAFQFRIGIRPQEESPVMRIAKGTLAPSRLSKLGESSLVVNRSIRDGNLRARVGYDIVLATSSFKGRKGKDAIQPGSYIVDMGLGVKSIAAYRKHSLGTQVLVNYPQAVKQEILPIIKQQAQQLAQDQKDPRKLIERYIQVHEGKSEGAEGLRCRGTEGKRSERNTILNLNLDDEYMNEQFSIFDVLDSGNQGLDYQDCESSRNKEKDLLLYSLLKADTSAFNQLIEHPKVIAQLQEFTRRQWSDIATGRSIKFTSGLAQPSLHLSENEICVPYLKDGEEIIVTRSPLINSNGVITLKNKHLNHTQTGCVYIHPKTAMDNMQCDFDGDLLAFAPVSEFPILAAEVKYNNLPQNRYPDIVKKAKIPYQGTFAQIAISAMENKIGIIANQIQKNIALQCEVCNLPLQQKAGYLQKVSAHLTHLLHKHDQGELKIPDKIREGVQEFILTPNERVELVESKELADKKIDNKLYQFKKILKECVSELGNELQIATDGPKSALRPDDAILDYTQAITDYKEVEWLKDKKNREAFTNRGMKTNGYSPIDLMIEQTNQIFEENQLSAKARPVEQFRGLYPQVEFTPQQREQAQKIKNTYNSLIRERILLEERQKVSESPYLVITSPYSGKSLEIDNLIKFDIAKNPQFWKLSQLSIKISSQKPNELSSKISSPLFAQGKFRTLSGKEVYLPIGSISPKSIKEHDLRPGMFIENGVVEFHPGVDKSRIDVLKQQTKEYVESVRNNTPEDEKLKLAAAIHDVSHTPDNKNYSGLKRASVAFTIFPEIVIEQLKQLQFTQMRIIGIQFNEFAHQSFNGEKVPIEFEDGINPRDPTKTARWIKVEGKKLGIIDARSPNLISGCKALANIHSPPINSIIASSLRNSQNQLKIDNVNKYAFASHQWKGETKYITFDVEQTHSGKIPKVFALIDNRVLGVVNKQSVSFLQQQLQGRNLQGLKIKAKVDKAPASYVDIVIDPDSVEFPTLEVEKQQKLGNVVSDKQEVVTAVVEEKLEQEQQHSESSLISFSEAQLDKSDVCKVLFFAPPVTQQFKERTEQVMSNMLQRAVDRAVQNGFGTVEFIDVSPISHKSPLIAQTLHQLQEYRKDINVEFVGTKSLEEGMRLLTKTQDIAIGVKSIATSGIIEILANQDKAVAAYIPEIGDFDRRNLPILEKKYEIERD